MPAVESKPEPKARLDLEAAVERIPRGTRLLLDELLRGSFRGVRTFKPNR